MPSDDLPAHVGAHEEGCARLLGKRDRLNKEFAADYSDMTFTAARQEIEVTRKAFPSSAGTI